MNIKDIAPKILLQVYQLRGGNVPSLKPNAQYIFNNLFSTWHILLPEDGTLLPKRNGATLQINQPTSSAVGRGRAGRPADPTTNNSTATTTLQR
jgi:hypothetical protein